MKKTPHDTPTHYADRKPDERLLIDAQLAFEVAQRPLTEGYDPEHLIREEAWRKSPMFNMVKRDPVAHIVYRECGRALRDFQYRQPLDPASARNPIPNVYSEEEKVNLTKLLHVSVHPQQKGQKYEDYRLALEKGLIAPNEQICIQMQDIALMRYHLGVLCDKLGWDEFTPGKLLQGDTRRKLEDFAKSKGTYHGNTAANIIETSDYLARKTAELAASINEQMGKEVLTNKNIVTVDFAGRRSR